MTDGAKTRPQIVQARRFADSLTYNAWSALTRVEGLLNDAEEIDALLEAEQQAADAPHRSWYGFEVVSYYLVGFVTGLEWHVRTRLADLYTFRPEAIDRKALDGKINPESLSQMIRAGVTIPHLLSASTTVSSAADYFGALQHIFDTLGIARSAAKVVPDPPPMTSVFGDEIIEPTAFQTLEALFAARHALVHEIGIARGQRADANNWAARDVRPLGGAALGVMRAFERVLTDEAPPDFPNLLDARGYPVDELERLRRRVADATARIAGGRAAAPGQRDAWSKASASQGALHDYIVGNPLLLRRHADHAPTLTRLELEQRLKLLEALADALEAPD